MFPHISLLTIVILFFKLRCHVLFILFLHDNNSSEDSVIYNTCITCINRHLYFPENKWFKIDKLGQGP